MIEDVQRTTWRVGRWAVALALAVSVAAGRLPGQERPVAPRAGQRPPVEQLAELVKQRLDLTDEQALKLRQSTRRFAVERQRLVQGERAARRELRTQIEAGDAADQRRVGVLLDTLLVLQRRRVDLLASEQRELATFLSPVQRAGFMAMQERAFRAAQQARLGREGGARRAPWRGDTSAPPF